MNYVTFRISSLWLGVILIAVVATDAGARVIENRLAASDGTQSFGEDVSISGNWAIIGAPLDDDAGDNNGAAYTFERQSDGSWVETDKLIASDTYMEQRFGQSVAISGNFALVGVPADSDAGTSAGAAYVFQRQGNGAWLELEKLTASDAVAVAQFGFKVSILGGRALIGAPGDDDLGAGSGSAYVFEQQSNGSWDEVAKLTASDGAALANVGISVSLTEDRALVGAAHDPSPPGSGSAYVFERQGDGSWIEMYKLMPSDGTNGNIFGISVAISGDYALAGSSNSSPQGDRSGSAYAFERQGDGSWIESDKLLASDGVELDFFGFAVSVEGEYAAIGAYAVATDGDRGDGAVYAFERQSDGTWTELDKLVASDAMSGYLGITLALSNGRLLAGASASEGGGAAYLYEGVFPVSLEPLPGETPAFRLSPLRPNPFVEEASFSLTLQQSQHVRIEFVDVLGRVETMIFDGALSGHSSHAFSLISENLAPGVYFVRVIGESIVEARSVTLLK